jgi:hypothetical protein
MAQGRGRVSLTKSVNDDNVVVFVVVVVVVFVDDDGDVGGDDDDFCIHGNEEDVAISAIYKLNRKYESLGIV